MKHLKNLLSDQYITFWDVVKIKDGSTDVYGSISEKLFQATLLRH
jgi:hypothetical protein